MARFSRGTPRCKGVSQVIWRQTRATDLNKLAPAFIAVGSIDLFLDEDCDYALRLTRACVPVELHVYRGVFHAFDLLPGQVTNRFTADLNNAIKEFL